MAQFLADVFWAIIAVYVLIGAGLMVRGVVLMLLGRVDPNDRI